MCVMIKRLKAATLLSTCCGIFDDEDRRGQKNCLRKHAEEKFEILRRHGFVVSKRQVRETLQRPEKD